MVTTESLSEPVSPVGFCTWRAKRVLLETATLVPRLAWAGTLGRGPGPVASGTWSVARVPGVPALPGLSEEDIREGWSEAWEAGDSM